MVLTFGRTLRGNVLRFGDQGIEDIMEEFMKMRQKGV